jgi:methyl-accepting chemotaxis protein
MKLIKIRTVLLAGIAGGTGYVLGTRAGRGRFEELKVQADKLRSQAEKLARSPQVHETVGNVADKLKETAAKLPDPVADAVTKVADTAHEATAPAEDAAPEAGGTAEGTPLAGVTVEDVGPVASTEPETNPGV